MMSCVVVDPLSSVAVHVTVKLPLSVKVAVDSSGFPALVTKVAPGAALQVPTIQ